MERDEFERENEELLGKIDILKRTSIIVEKFPQIPEVRKRLKTPMVMTF